MVASSSSLAGGSLAPPRESPLDAGLHAATPPYRTGPAAAWLCRTPCPSPGRGREGADGGSTSSSRCDRLGAAMTHNLRVAAAGVFLGLPSSVTALGVKWCVMQVPPRSAYLKP